MTKKEELKAHHAELAAQEWRCAAESAFGIESELFDAQQALKEVTSNGK